MQSDRSAGGPAEAQVADRRRGTVIGFGPLFPLHALPGAADRPQIPG
jgi:hypothetical protein